MTTGLRSGMPSAARWTSASCRNSRVTMIAVGRPSASSRMPSCVQHDVHDPQSPIAVRTMSLSAAIAAIRAGSAVLAKLALQIGLVPLIGRTGPDEPKQNRVQVEQIISLHLLGQQEMPARRRAEA